MSEHNYPPPVDKLLTYGECQGARLKWANYLELGFTSAHIPDLIRMATDDKLNWADSESLEVWAPIHAWRALAQLHAEAAVGPLLGILDELRKNHDDWSLEEFPEVFGCIGPAAIPMLRAYLANDTHLLFSHICTMHCLERIGTAHPQTRDECVAILIHHLERFAENDPTLNGFLISYMLDLKAVEAVPIIERAFEADSVDQMVMGDLEDALIELGVQAERTVPRKIPSQVQEFREAIESLAVRSAQSSEGPASPQPRKSKAKKRDKKQPGQRLRGNKRKK